MKGIFKPAVRGLVNADAGIGNKTAAELAEKVTKNYTRPMLQLTSVKEV